ncbi:MAG: prolyl oligopeptidase family serine peptidase [Pirellula sp.]|jgi:pimeloyl-ACP methyl ester carboxylesterase|nr:prolyl oligopeptidase family serine peptidase [Pirellula sp.]
MMDIRRRCRPPVSVSPLLASWIVGVLMSLGLGHSFSQEKSEGKSVSSPASKATTAPGKLSLPGDSFTILDRPAFVFMPEEAKRSSPQPWIFYAPTLPAYPDEAERWMHQSFLDAGIAIAGVDVGEAYGSPASHSAFNALYEEVTTKRGFAKKACLFGRSRGGLWVSSWAIAYPEKVAGIIGIYPVYDFRTYPKLEAAAPAYGLSSQELDQRSKEFNPIERISALARAQIPVTIIHGDQDVLVPLEPNSAELKRVYKAEASEELVNLIVAPGQGHSFWEGFFREPRLVQFAIERARAGAK